ncbi:uncharacterized protein Z518_10500 [Rhinocladiella mackenziei CBS 650.93]|uniref:C2H2-type domain-containing protein n=1 Tax=Rhinocladiella mackenziei CBS 650.93 TaxID=1442369 RepID=A0A0D2IAR7_9EURO|nr:uncharacterized protein Z518_10500 [Rhinocladiella mackenziei CBS 650.93]KIX00361.1 hypothetical protein Z518_10500 [Rhinocladiella mackenziei CBS 650.93]
MAEPSTDPQISPEGSILASSTFDKPTSPTKSPFEPKTASSDDSEASTRPEKRPRLEPPQMTAAIALAEAPKTSVPLSPPSPGTSPNPPQQVLNALMGAHQNVMSKAPQTTSDRSPDPATTVSEPLAVVAENIRQPAMTVTESSATGDNHAAQTSPTSISSTGTLENVAGASGMTTTVGSPLPIEETVRQVVNAAEAGSTSPGEGSKALSYPAPLLQPQVNEGARRGMSLPHSGTRQGTRSPSSKKHRCPYCATEFTRHHNLKSHLLTHSQEKPYVCSTCQSRFRRLHDLKRHTKLHTGERPHICPKCGRKFARGDALARHNKGPGGCAGRRASMGSFGGGDEDAEGDDSMEGVVYNEPDTMDDEEGNDKRPGIRRQAPSGDDSVDDPDHTSRIPSTYPPIQGRPPGGIAGGFFPPRAGFNPSTSGPSSAPAASAGPLPFPAMSSSSPSSRPSGAGNTVYASNPMTESPKPLSPGHTQRASVSGEGGLNRNRSPTMTHYQQPSYSRASGTGSSLSVPSTAPQLPPPHVLNPPDARYTLPSQGGPAHPPTQPSGPPTHMGGSGPLSSHSNSLSSHGHSGHGSGEASNPIFPKEDRIWAYVASLEQRMNSMQEEINSLKHQLASATQVQQQQRQQQRV